MGIRDIFKRGQDRPSNAPDPSWRRHYELAPPPLPPPMTPRMPPSVTDEERRAIAERNRQALENRRINSRLKVRNAARRGKRLRRKRRKRKLR